MLVTLAKIIISQVILCSLGQAVESTPMKFIQKVVGLVLEMVEPYGIIRAIVGMCMILLGNKLVRDVINPALN